jgi:hypothetical protein
LDGGKFYEYELDLDPEVVIEARKDIEAPDVE